MKIEEIKNNFIKMGYFDNINKLKLKDNIKNILILTSETGAAYQDFLYT